MNIPSQPLSPEAVFCNSITVIRKKISNQQEKEKSHFLAFGYKYRSRIRWQACFLLSIKVPAANNRLSSTVWNLDGMLKLFYWYHGLWYEISPMHTYVHVKLCMYCRVKISDLQFFTFILIIYTGKKGSKMQVSSVHFIVLSILYSSSTLGATQLAGHCSRDKTQTNQAWFLTGCEICSFASHTEILFSKYMAIACHFAH